MKIHCIGIGGIGVSALARYYLAKGFSISGSDLYDSEIIQDLREVGVNIKVGKQISENIPLDVDMIIYSAAVQEDNLEMQQAKNLKKNNQKLELLSYAQALGKLTRDHFTIAVSGTHGKSTTVSMLSLILVKANLDPTVIMGTKLKEFGNSNFRLGGSKYLVIEADEWQGSFLNYYPQIIVLTNIEEDHLDYYRDLKHINETYCSYLENLSSEGVLVYNEDDDNLKKLASNCSVKNKISFSMDQKEATKISQIIKIPGEHNIRNALAALNAAKAIGVPEEVACRAMEEYQTCWRRFDQKKARIGSKNILLIHDYAHHPTEVKALLQTLEEKFKEKSIYLVFQPHQYQRVFYFFDRFVKVFQENLDSHNEYHIIVTDIYDVPGREKSSFKKKVSAFKMVQAINRSNVFYCPLENLDRFLSENIKENDIIVAAGAGNIYRWASGLQF